MYIQKQFASRVGTMLVYLISTSYLISMHEIAAFLSRDFSKEEGFLFFARGVRYFIAGSRT